MTFTPECGCRFVSGSGWLRCMEHQNNPRRERPTLTMKHFCKACGQEIT